jgi:hexosaminidase
MDMEWIREYADQMMGIQGSMWTEFCDSPDDVTYQIFPRIAALAEVAWSPSGAKDWEKFLVGLDSFNEHLEEKGVVYSESMYNIQHTVTPVGNGAVAVNLHCERPDVSVRYTVDGSQPDEDSRLFSRKIWFRNDGTLKAATFFDDGRQAGQTLTLRLDGNAATGRRIYSGHPSCDQTEEIYAAGSDDSLHGRIQGNAGVDQSGQKEKSSGRPAGLAGFAPYHICMIKY